MMFNYKQQNILRNLIHMKKNLLYNQLVWFNNYKGNENDDMAIFFIYGDRIDSSKK